MVVRTLETTPPDATHWSTRSMAKVLRVNPSTGAGAPTNPFAQAPLVYTYGRRNPQGLARRPGQPTARIVAYSHSKATTVVSPPIISVQASYRRVTRIL